MTQIQMKKPLLSFQKDPAQMHRTQQTSTMTNPEKAEKVSLPEIMAYNANRLGMKNMSIVSMPRSMTTQKY